MCQKLLGYSQGIWSCVRTSTLKIPFAGPPRSKCRTKCSCHPGTILQKPTAFSPQRLEMFFSHWGLQYRVVFSTCHVRCAKRTYSAQKVTSWALLHWVSVSLRSRPPFPITCIDANRQNKTMWQAQKQTQGDSKASETWVCHTHIKPYSYIWWFPKKGVPPQIIHFTRIFQLTAFLSTPLPVDCANDHCTIFIDDANPGKWRHCAQETSAREILAIHP